VVAVLPYGLHHAVVPDILEAGRPCLTEKPIAVRAETGRRLAEMAQSRGVVYQVGYMKRCDPGSRYAKQLIGEWRASGEHGRLRYVRVEMPPGNWTAGIGKPLSAGDAKARYAGQLQEPVPEWMDPPTGKLYNAFINYYIHQVNLVRYLLGEDYTVRYADPSGVTFSATSEGGAAITLEMAAYHCRDHWEEAYTVWFEKGTVRLDLPAPTARQHSGCVRIYRGAGEVTRFEEPVLEPRWSMQEQSRLFVATVRGEGPNLSPAVEAVHDLETAEQYVRCLLASREA